MVRRLRSAQLLRGGRGRRRRHRRRRRGERGERPGVDGLIARFILRGELVDRFGEGGDCVPIGVGLGAPALGGRYDPLLLAD